jgi:two-component system chemotaxis response regulator CheB
VVGVVLIGGGHDGAQGLLDIDAAGGISIVQDPNEAAAPSMPRHAIERDHPNTVLPLQKIAEALTCVVNGGTWRQ